VAPRGEGGVTQGRRARKKALDQLGPNRRERGAPATGQGRPQTGGRLRQASGEVGKRKGKPRKDG